MHLAMSCKLLSYIQAFPLYGTLGLPIYLLLTNMVLEFVIGWLFSKTQSTSAFFLEDFWKDFIYLFLFFVGQPKELWNFRFFGFLSVNSTTSAKFLGIFSVTFNIKKLKTKNKQNKTWILHLGWTRTYTGTTMVKAPHKKIVAYGK